MVNSLRDYLSKYFEYSEESSSGLIYKTTSLNLSRIFGDSAGIVEYKKNGTPTRWVVSLNRKKYLAHRIVWMLNNGEITSDQIIDHIDGNPLNNKLDNLRLVSYKENNRNRKLAKSNKTGICGVFFERIERGG